jgi:capsular exopolysaccharide synthesis family protein
VNEQQPVYLDEPQALASSSSVFNIQEYLELLARRWPVILVLAILGLVIGGIRFYLTPAMYRAQTTLQIEQRSLLSVGSSQNPWLEAWAGMKYYPTQYRLLESRGLAERVIVDLNLLDEPRFNPRAGESSIEGGDPAASDAGLLAALAGKIQAGLSVRAIKQTELVTISYEGEHPELAARIVNGISDAYIDWGIERRSEFVGKASTFLEQQVGAFKQEIDEKEKQLQEFGRDIDVVNLDPESNEIVERITQLNRTYTQAIADRVEIEARYHELTGASAIANAEANPTPLISEGRRNLLALEREYEAKLTVYKKDHPVMLDLEARIAEQRQSLTDIIEGEVATMKRNAAANLQTARRRERSLKDQFERARREAMALNSVSVEMKNLEMEIATRRELLDQLLRRQSETGMTARMQTTREANVRVIDRALVPSRPYRPSMNKSLTTGAGAGLTFGVALVLFFHFLDRSIKSAEELERLLGLPVLAVIADLSSKGRRAGIYGYYGRGRRRRGKTSREPTAEKAKQIELVPTLNPRLGVSEAYRSLRTALLLSTAGGIKVMTITSAEAGEGKTATAVNLSAVMAQLGRKTLIIDADLRKARLHRILGVSNRVGLVNVLAEGLELDSALQSTSIDNLTVLPSGPHPPNPSELLASEPMLKLLEQAKTLFDVVIIDSPPVLAVTDAILAGKLSDGVLLCFRAGKVQREDARACRDQLQLAGVRILGTLLNCYQPAATGRYDRRYYYHYAYEGYADDDSEASAGNTAA